MHHKTKKEYNLNRLKTIVAGHLNRTAKEIKEAIISDINKFSNYTRHDDLTLIVVKKISI